MVKNNRFCAFEMEVKRLSKERAFPARLIAVHIYNYITSYLCLFCLYHVSRHQQQHLPHSTHTALPTSFIVMFMVRPER